MPTSGCSPMSVKGNLTLFMRRDELDAAWRWIDPIRDGWAQHDERAKVVYRRAAGDRRPRARSSAATASPGMMNSELPAHRYADVESVSRELATEIGASLTAAIAARGLRAWSSPAADAGEVVRAAARSGARLEPCVHRPGRRALGRARTDAASNEEAWCAICCSRTVPPRRVSSA